jgi:hypothetical protein
MLRRLFRNRWVRGTAVTLLILLTVVTLISLNGYYSLRHRGGQHQAQVLAELDAADPGWRWEHIQASREKGQQPSETNVIEQAVRVRDRFPKEGYGEWVKVDTSGWKRTPGEPPSADELAHARQLVTACRELMPEARGLRHLSGGVVVPLAENPLATLLPHVQKPREVAVLLQQDALVNAADGKFDDALDDALAVLAMAGGLADEPFLVGQLVRLALVGVTVRMVERTLWAGDPSDAKLGEVQEALSAAAKVNGYVTALRGERAGMTKLAELLEKDPRNAEGLLPGQPPPPVVTSVATSALLPETHARYLQLMTRAITVAEKPAGPERNAEFAQMDADLRADTSLEGQALRLVFPAVHKCYEVDVRTVALLHAAVCAVMAERFRLKESYFPVVQKGQPTDPFTGNPLVFKKFDDGIAVYSTGPDGKDDGGENVTDGGTKAGFDWGVRLYDKRR